MRGRTPIHRRWISDDRGSVLLLTMGVVVVSLLAIAVVSDVTSAFLQRRALASLADSAALSAAQAIDLDSYYSAGAAGLRLDPRRAGAAVARHLRVTRAREGMPGVAVESIEVRGREVTVTLRAPVRLPFSSLATGPSLARASATAGIRIR